MAGYQPCCDAPNRFCRVNTFAWTTLSLFTSSQSSSRKFLFSVYEFVFDGFSFGSHIRHHRRWRSSFFHVFLWVVWVHARGTLTDASGPVRVVCRCHSELAWLNRRHSLDGAVLCYQIVPLASVARSRVTLHRRSSLSFVLLRSQISHHMHVLEGASIFDSIVKEGKSRAENDVRKFHHKQAQQQAMSVFFFFVCVVNQNRFSREWERACCCYCCASDECELCPSPTVNRHRIDSCICNEFVFNEDIGVLLGPVASFLIIFFSFSYNAFRFEAVYYIINIMTSVGFENHYHD